MNVTLDTLSTKIACVPNFPKTGIHFRHIGPLLHDHEAMNLAIDSMIDQIDPTLLKQVDVICGLESRGFIFATALQARLRKPQVLLRKSNKLPGEKLRVTYDLEYGQDALELEVGCIQPGDKVLLVDDLLATGGTLSAAIKLVKLAGGVSFIVNCLIELDGLNGRNTIGDDIHIFTVLVYSSESSDLKPLRINRSRETKITTEEAMKKPTSSTSMPIHYTPQSYIPVESSFAGASNGCQRPVLMWHPTLESMATNILRISSFRPSYIDWSCFPDGWLNVRFEDNATLKNRDVTFLMSLEKKETLGEQLCMLIALPRQGIRSLNILIPYLGPATHERVDKSGVLATVEPVLKMISSSIPSTQSGPPILRVYDIHALPILFYTTDNVRMELISAIPILKQELERSGRRPVIAFPDDGAYKRFRYQFQGYPMLVCSKIRNGDERLITIAASYNWPTDPTAITNCLEHVLIVDDLVQSGGTLIECGKALRSKGYRNISCYVTHAVFPNEAWRKFLIRDELSTDNAECGIAFDQFYITNTNPNVANLLQGQAPFRILPIESHFVEELKVDLSPKNPCLYLYPKPKGTTIYVASTNTNKLSAVYNHYCCSKYTATELGHLRVFGVNGCSSGVPEQPISEMETKIGAKNRLESLYEKIVSSHPDDAVVLVAIENGIVIEETMTFSMKTNNAKEGGQESYNVCSISKRYLENCSISKRYLDQAFMVVLDSQTHTTRWFRSPTVDITKHAALVHESISKNQSVTVGSLIEKHMGYEKDHWHEQLDSERRTRAQLIELGFSEGCVLSESPAV